MPTDHPVRMEIRDDEVARSFWDSLSAPWRVDPLDKQRYVRS